MAASNRSIRARDGRELLAYTALIFTTLVWWPLLGGWIATLVMVAWLGVWLPVYVVWHRRRSRSLIERN